MPPLTTHAIVLRYANYRDNDRMLTLFSPELGRIDAAVRGVRKPKSALRGAAELFATGVYTLYQNQGRHTVTGCAVQDGFYPLRLSMDALNAGVYLLNLTEAAIQPGEGNEVLFYLLLRALTHLAYGDAPPKAVAAAYIVQYALILGYKPRLQHCAVCGKRLPPEEAQAFSISVGGVVCPACAEGAEHVSPRQVAWMQAVVDEGIDAFSKAGEDVPFSLLSRFVAYRLERPIKSSALLG